ncbi:MAG: response regulator transcription factor [Steroidobacteraceae bacterium]
MHTWPQLGLEVLIAEDDLDLLGVIGMTLHNAGFSVTKVNNGADALEALAKQVFALVILDINMPQVNGLQVCTTLRARSSVPVMMLSARDQESDLLNALDAGADAYMLKPFSPRAMVARINALLRRRSFNELNVLQVGLAKLDTDNLTLTLPQEVVRLTKLEIRLLHLLMKNAGQTVSRKILIDEVWDTYSTANRNMLKQVIFRLRRKLLQDPEAFAALGTTPDGYIWHVPAVNPAQVPALA